MNVAVCPKCKEKAIKVITPAGKEGIWFMCEKCGFEKQLKGELAKRLHDVELYYISMLSHRWAQGDLDINDVRDYKLEQFNRIMEEYG